MTRKFELHLDALIFIALLFASAIGFIAYQRYNYSELLRDNIGRQMKQLTLELEVARLEALLNKATKAGQGTSGATKAGERAARH